MQARSANSAATEREMIQMAEEELARLQRQLRIMEDDRMAFSDETTTKLDKQKKIIQTLKIEKQKLIEEINVASCENQKKQDKKLSKEIYKQLEMYEKFCEEVDKEKENISEMDVQIKKVENEIRKLRPKSSVTENYFQNRLSSGQKSIQILRNRLDNMIKKFCAVLAENKSLREEIDHLLIQRNHFNEIWEKLLSDINFGKRFIVDLIEQATLAFDQREEWCSKLEALKNRAEMDLATHSEEKREIQRRLDHYMSLREFLCVKGQRRIMKDLEERERKKKQSEIEDLESQLRMYDSTLKKIREFCNEHDVDRIAALFLKQEEENFALFNYVNELTHEIESFNSVLDELHEKIDEQIEVSRLRAKERQATVVSLRDDLKIATDQADADENEVKIVETQIVNLLKGIEEVFDIVECDRGPILKLLGSNTAINLFNVNIYLGTIEKKLSDVITELYFAEKSMMPHKKNHKKHTRDEEI